MFTPCPCVTNLQPKIDVRGRVQSAYDRYDNQVICLSHAVTCRGHDPPFRSVQRRVSVVLTNKLLEEDVSHFHFHR